jgi:hypothetical protein
MSSTFRAADGFRAAVAITSTMTTLPLKATEATALCAALGDGYTYLTMRNVWGFEIVKATCAAGVVSIERGASPLGGDVCVAFEWTQKALTDLMAQGGASPALCEIKAGSDRLTVKMDGCTATLDKPACDGAAWRAGNAVFTQSPAGCVASQPVAAGLALRPGTYKNATVTVNEAGEIVAIAEGDNIVFTGGGCCTTTGAAP